jgi:cytochrome c oxidase cbb3-type subunit I/II
MRWHRRWERLPLTFTIWVVIAVVAASLFEIIPTFVIRSNVATIASVQPYTPLEVAGRDIYVSEGCYNCHSQMVRPMRHETERFGEYSKAGEFVYDRPFQWGSRRIGPDLHRISQRNPSVLWHVRHLNDPTSTSEGSIMPAYPWLLERDLDFASIAPRVAALAKLGAPYGEELERAEEMAREQADAIMARLVEEDATFAGSGLEGKKVIAVVAYLLRLGTDITRSAPEPEAPAAVVRQ